VATVLDFNPADGDRLDLRDLVTGYSPATSVLGNFVQLATQAGNTSVLVNADGVGTDFQPAATLNGLTGLLLDEMNTQANLVLV
jgi:hypothetical protein